MVILKFIILSYQIINVGKSFSMPVLSLVLGKIIISIATYFV